MEISYDYYRVFYYVAKYQNVTHAATILGSNQPSVSKCINNLEKQLGCRLFVRSNRGVKLTREAEKLYAHVSIAYDQFKAAESELVNDKSLQNGVVTIGISANTLHGVVLPSLKKFRYLYPGVKLCVSSSASKGALNALREGLVDFSIVTTPLDIPDNYEKTFLRNFQDILLGGKQYEFLAEKAHYLQDLTEYPMVFLNKGTATYHYYEQLFKERGLILKPDVEVASADQLLPMIINNLGIGFVADYFLDNVSDLNNIVKIPVKDGPQERGIYLLEDKSKRLSVVASEFKRMLLSENQSPMK